MNLLANSLSRHNHFIFYFMHFVYSELNRPDQPGLAWDYRLCRNQTFRCCCSLLPLLKKTRQGLGKENNGPLGHKDIILATCQKSHVKKQELWKTYLFWLVLPTPADGILHKSWKNKKNADTLDCRYINELTALKRTTVAFKGETA